jgi:hypothetical protein
MITEEALNVLFENNAKSNEKLLKYYTTQVLYIYAKNSLSNELQKAFYKLYYLNSDNFCIVDKI